MPTKFTLPELPKEIKTFTSTEFGRHTPRGYHPGLVASVIKDIPIEHISGEWLNNKNGKHCYWEFFDKNGIAIGYIVVSSDNVLRCYPEFSKLIFQKYVK